MSHQPGFHPLDELSQAVWEAVQERVKWTQEAVSGPVTLGTRRANRQEALRSFLEMGPIDRLRAASQSDLSGVNSMLFKLLGEHAFNILPYVGTTEENPNQELDEVPPDQGGFL